MGKKITYEKEPELWMSLMTAAQGNIVTAIKQFRRLGYSDADIRGVLDIELMRGINDGKA